VVCLHRPLWPAWRPIVPVAPLESNNDYLFLPATPVLQFIVLADRLENSRRLTAATVNLRIGRRSFAVGAYYAGGAAQSSASESTAMLRSGAGPARQRRSMPVALRDS
jgi:hypothetical protein